MDERGYTFTPLALLLMIPVIMFAVSYGDIVDELNALSALAIGGDVTSNIGVTIIQAVQDDTYDAGRNSAFNATKIVINSYQLIEGNNPWIPNSMSYVEGRTLALLNNNMTQTCRVLENQTGRNITINGVAIDPNSNTSVNIFQNTSPSSPGYLDIYQTDPFGFYVNVTGVPVVVTQNNQMSQFKTPSQTVYVSIEGLEDPYIWANTKARNTSVIYHYPQYDAVTKNYRLHEFVNGTTGNVSYLKECLTGQNVSVYSQWGPRPFYIVDPHGLSFFDRLEGKTNNTATSPVAARMSTFIIYDPTAEEHPNIWNISCIDHEYFDNIQGTTVQTRNMSAVGTPRLNMTCPGSGKIFYLSSTYKGYLDLNGGPYPFTYP